MNMATFLEQIRKADEATIAQVLSSAITECNKRTLLSKAYVPLADKIAKHVAKTVSYRATGLDNLSERAEKAGNEQITKYEEAVRAYKTQNMTVLEGIHAGLLVKGAK